jgi:hypothetical protein
MKYLQALVTNDINSTVEIQREESPSLYNNITDSVCALLVCQSVCVCMCVYDRNSILFDRDDHGSYHFNVMLFRLYYRELYTVTSTKATLSTAKTICRK